MEINWPEVRSKLCYESESISLSEKSHHYDEHFRLLFALIPCPTKYAKTLPRIFITSSRFQVGTERCSSEIMHARYPV